MDLHNLLYYSSILCFYLFIAYLFLSDLCFICIIRGFYIGLCIFARRICFLRLFLEFKDLFSMFCSIVRLIICSYLISSHLRLLFSLTSSSIVLLTKSLYSYWSHTRLYFRKTFILEFGLRKISILYSFHLDLKILSKSFNFLQFLTHFLLKVPFDYWQLYELMTAVLSFNISTVSVRTLQSEQRGRSQVWQ